MPAHILGISAFYHDAAACLVRDGRIVAAAQEERFTRRRHDAEFPAQAVAYCLREGGIEPGEVTHLAFYEKPWITFERLLETYVAHAPRGLRSWLKAMPVWVKEKLWIADRLREETGFAGEVLYPEHHVSHAASAFYPSPFRRAAILTMDAVGEWATSSWGAGEGGRMELRAETRFPHSLGLLYSAFSYYLGFRVNSGEYKVMGLAPYGEPRYAQDILDNLVDLRPDGSLRLDMRYFNYAAGLTMTSDAFHRRFGGPPRAPESPLTRREMDLAASIQAVTDEVMVRTARHVRAQTGERDLVMAGGVALNCVANARILRAGIFDRIWIQPAAGDAGGALGAALWVWHQHLGNGREPSGDLARDGQAGSLLGPAFAGDEIAAWLTAEGLPFHRRAGDEAPRAAAELLAAGSVVGWFSGRMEFGPRALGARSILGDPRDPRTQSVMNLKIKNRESFRPFAPACLEEDAAEYFDLEVPSPYMLLVAEVRRERRIAETPEEAGTFGIDRLNLPRSDIPAVTHVDYSARVQTVSRERDPRFHALIREFKRLTGYGVVVNTSFNVRGEPIVCTPQDAYRCFMRTEMDALMLQDCLLLKAAQPARPEWTEGRDFAPD
ncbi:MAG TPA: carbamoyltransferase [Longimicrobium sp.]|jgi:carbamoyltransferase|uniref:carbamoyltransferase family protein n=1 Tax=Longimicrobium sp. TaxID=2029185 RepID=UPI002ED7D7EB